MAITTVAGINSVWPGQAIPVQKTGFLYSGASNLWSYWTTFGLPGAGATPTTAVVPDNTTAGAFPIANPLAGNTNYLAKMLTIGLSSAPSPWILYDRLAHSGGLSGIVTTAQTVNTPAWTRGDTTGVGVAAYLEIYTQLGATSTTATISYTNDAGTAGQSGTTTIPVSVPGRRLLPISLQAGDRGVRSVQSVTLAATTGTAGNFGVTLAKPIAEISSPGNTYSAEADWLTLNMAQIDSGACIALMAISAASITDTFYAILNVIQG